jgi:hypothetical protein
MNEMKPWYMSKSIWGGLVAAAASLGALMGMPVGPAEQQELTEAVLQAVGAGGALLAILGRITASERLF